MAKERESLIPGRKENYVIETDADAAAWTKVAPMHAAWDERKRAFDHLRNPNFEPGEYEKALDTYRTAVAEFDKAKTKAITR